MSSLASSPSLTSKRRRGSAVLCAEVDAAKLRRASDERELTERSELDSIKDEFRFDRSHELRTPLTSIRGALGLLSSGVLGTVDAQAQNLLRIALTNTERLIRLINDILDLQRMDSGLSVLQVRRCSLPELVHQAIETMAAMADSAEVKLTVSPLPSLSSRPSFSTATPTVFSKSSPISSRTRSSSPRRIGRDH